ncbi:autotransporter domain-containing protein [Sphingobium limneticum]|uniref:Autotransporter domain-containing protein n=1 Tax=Sphingobium limneticum TaxID=1007511 RepID=A0A5J5I7V5_9SPHN|nr:autotransporter outer membrane beta-barrel domain-containing protein [Sphingobium limneticum]KAA9020590.1 autotransporter domain-containing protein [Sphingobium limneticum]KAA9032915.1 autotransporter domain-containing protein [Sphingobium limneticum]
MRHLLACTAIAPVLAALTVADAAAETTIATATTAAVKTSTVANGAADDITISSAGSIKLTSGAAVTVDSNNKVSNAGTITINDANNVTGILVAPGTSGAIANTGTITLTEDYTATDTDSDGDIDGPFAKGSSKNGIWVQSGAAHVGNIDHSGTITIEGNQSAGIRLDGALTGNLSTSGTTSVIGDNSYGVVANGVTGNVTLRGSTSAVGANSIGAALLGDVTGAVKIQGTITSTGYRSTSRPSDVTKLDADDLLQGGSALVIAGNVTGGIIFDIPPTLDSTKPDVDGDGLTDATEGSAAVITYGKAAAVQIGAADRATTIGAVAAGNTGYGLIVNGGIAGYGVYDGVDANGLVIGGLGGAVSIAKGVQVKGTIAAVSYDSNATALRVGSGASAGTIEVGGSVAASGSTKDGTVARGLVIDSGATVGSIVVSGSVAAAAGSTEKGSAIAILDSSGSVSSLSNTGKISATGGKSGSNVAIDLSANSSGVTLTQAAASATATTMPSIVGDIRLGSGNDVLTVSAGAIAGNLSLGAGNDSIVLSGASSLTGNIAFGTGTNSLSLTGTSKVAGNVDFGGGAGTLTLGGTSSLTGAISNSGNVAVALNGGALTASNTGSVVLASLSASGTSTLGITINGATGASTVYDVAGAASFASGSQVKVNLTQVGGSVGNYVIVRAGSLSGSPTLTSAALLPYMFKSSVTGDNSAGTVTLSIAAKSVSELGLSGSTASAYSAIFNALDKDAAVAAAYLAVTDGSTLTGNLRQMLPDHAGGTFEAVTSGSRATARILSDPNGIYRTKDGRLGFWLQQVAFGSAKSVGSTASYDITGWGAGGGLEYLSDIGAFGGSFAYIHGSDSGGANNAVDSDQFEMAAHWRGQWGPLLSFARLSAARIKFDGTRHFESGDVTRTADGKWNGTLMSATAGAAYQIDMGRFSLRPAVGIDYYRLKEDGYSETGGGDAFNLTVLGRTSDELTANGTVTAGYDFGSLNKEDGWVRVELEGGRRQIVGGSLGDTTAYFKGGDRFTLVSEDRTNGWTGRARLYGGTDTFRVGGEFGAEEQQNHVAISFRATVNFVL